jgi:hypothetical protein
MSVVPHMRTHTDTRTNTHPRLLVCGCVRTCTHTDITHARACACAQTHTRTKIYARTRTFPLTRADGARCGVCASAIGRRDTPLHVAAIHGHADVAAALLTHGADVHAKSSGGCVLPVAILGSGRRAPRRAVADRDGIAAPHAMILTHTLARAIRSCTPARIDVAVCMRLDTHTDARTKAHARTRAQPRGATHARHRRPRMLRS